jgi:hypothetical protein
MKLFFVSLCILACNVHAKSQTSEDSVKAVVNNLFTAMKKADAALLLSCFADSAILQTIVKTKDGSIAVKNESVKNFAGAVGTAMAGALDERITYDMIKIDGALASVWTPYSFYYNGKFSHCGVNSFQLIKGTEGWKIQFLIDTRRKGPCQ